jgi:uncharacterized protein DUF3313
MNPRTFWAGASSAWAALVVGAIVFAAPGCKTTHQARHVEPSGFLKDYSKLREGTGDEALLCYVNPKTNFTRYNRILLDPVTIWRPADSNLEDLDEDDAQMLGDLLREKVMDELQKDYQFTETPGPNVLRLRLALTEAGGSRVALNTVTTILPLGLIVSHTKNLVTGTHTFVGNAATEVEGVDSLTDEQLFAAVDKRVGGKTLRGVFSKWDDVEKAFEYWAERLRTRLAEERANDQRAD